MQLWACTRCARSSCSFHLLRLTGWLVGLGFIQSMTHPPASSVMSCLALPAYPAVTPRHSSSPPSPTEVDIDSLPRRRTDGARILDRSKHALKLYTSDGGTKLLRRPDGKVERQHRLNVGSLPVAYTSDKPPGAGEDADLVYIMDRAVTSYHSGEWQRVVVGDGGGG